MLPLNHTHTHLHTKPPVVHSSCVVMTDVGQRDWNNWFRISRADWRLKLLITYNCPLCTHSVFIELHRHGFSPMKAKLEIQGKKLNMESPGIVLETEVYFLICLRDLNVFWHHRWNAITHLFSLWQFSLSWLVIWSLNFSTEQTLKIFLTEFEII